MSGDGKQMVGEWTVKFKHWVWEYTCTAALGSGGGYGNATWRDPISGDKGTGHWYVNGRTVDFSWTGSPTTKESWDCPISDENTGTYNASYGTGPVTSKRKKSTWGLGRGLTPEEITLVQSVFGPSLPPPFLATKVMIHGHKGLGSRPFTGISAGIGRYEIYMGESAFDAGPKSAYYKQTLIHEMTHVWQGRYSTFGVVGVWMSSIKCQIQRQGNAYVYGEGNLGEGKKKWDDFGKEEQAKIVEDWYTNGMKRTPDEKRFPYIRDHIWKGEN